MTPYTKKELDKFPEEITTTAPTIETENLFKVRDYKYIRPLHEIQASKIHPIVVKLLLDRV